MMVALSALHAGLLDLPAAAAVAIGADLGTTSTVLIGAIKGGVAKRRVAAGHFGFNLVTDIIAFSLITPLLAAVALVGIEDPLLALVAFHSLFNLLGIALFLPFIRHFALLLERHIGDRDTAVNRHLGSVTADLPEAALEALELECAHLLQRVVRENSHIFQPTVRISRGMLPVGRIEPEAWPLETEFGDAYETTKVLEGEILAFAIDTQSNELDPSQADRVDRLQRTVREAVHSSKSLKDIVGDLHTFDSSALTIMATYHQRFKDVFTEFYLTLYAVRHHEERLPGIDDLITLAALARRSHDEMHHAIYADVRQDRLSEHDISSLLNTNRELFNSNRSLIAALAAFVLTSEQLTVFESLPDTAA
jgi:phosphate:Na+ symporter